MSFFCLSATIQIQALASRVNERRILLCQTIN
nr:MAG TPA: hypothetical protein [Caudoviricetes sp.]